MGDVHKNRIAVILTCHNRKQKTMLCLEALYNCILPKTYEFKVFLVDDGSTDGTSDVITSNFKAVNIIKGSGQLYWNGGMRLAWETAAKFDFDYYLWLNDDTSLFPDAFEELIKISQLKGDKSIVCGVTQSAFSDAITYSGFCNDKMIQPNGTIQKCDSFNGNIVLISRYVYGIVGNLDSIFSHSIGDIDYGLRATKKNINLYITTRSIGYCENNPRLPYWCRPEYSFISRFKHLYSPLGYATPAEFFIFEKRHYGIIKATKHFITIHIRLIFPKLWK